MELQLWQKCPPFFPAFPEGTELSKSEGNRSWCLCFGAAPVYFSARSKAFAIPCRLKWSWFKGSNGFNMRVSQIWKGCSPTKSSRASGPAWDYVHKETSSGAAHSLFGFLTLWRWYILKDIKRQMWQRGKIATDCIWQNTSKDKIDGKTLLPSSVYTKPINASNGVAKVPWLLHGFTTLHFHTP